jgi:hypothetical protein
MAEFAVDLGFLRDLFDLRVFFTVRVVTGGVRLRIAARVCSLH